MAGTHHVSRPMAVLHYSNSAGRFRSVSSPAWRQGRNATCAWNARFPPSRRSAA